MGFLFSFVVVGILLQLAARAWPVREFDDAMEVRLDAVALLVALVCQFAVAAASFPLIQGVQDVGAVHSSYEYLSTLSPLSAGLFYFLVVDFLAYWMHRLNHVGWLWPTHAFHHSSRNLYWASGMRGSPVHFVLLGVPSMLVQVVFDPQGVVLWLVLAYGVAHNSIIHSNVRIPTRALNWIFVTGRSHLVHHGRDPRLGGSNFGFLFTFWDRLFGTWLDPDSLEPNHPLGIGYQISPVRLVIGLPAQQVAAPSRSGAALPG
jgi:sterol desaturase/sphingolipid hydroxylase (fatty acid hydroxylase superfamily)